MKYSYLSVDAADYYVGVWFFMKELRDNRSPNYALVTKYENLYQVSMCL